jgi:hypothetical protein
MFLLFCRNCSGSLGKAPRGVGVGGCRSTIRGCSEQIELQKKIFGQYKAVKLEKCATSAAPPKRIVGDSDRNSVGINLCVEIEGNGIAFPSAKSHDECCYHSSRKQGFQLGGIEATYARFSRMRYMGVA